MRQVYNDGGRADAGFHGTTGDCFTRAVAIATGLDYRVVYDTVNDYGKRERPRSGRVRTSARTGPWPATMQKIMKDLGWVWTPTMSIGSGCTTHLRDGEIPMFGPVIVRVSKHITAVVDGVIYDTHDPSRGGERCVYGYWRRPPGGGRR